MPRIPAVPRRRCAIDKFGRNYELLVTTVSGTLLTIAPPFTLEFDITRNTLTSANVCQLRIYNLGEKTRNQIRHNATDFGQPYQAVQLRAGYGENMPVIFSGNISQAWSVREGTNFITQIECYDGGFAFINGTTSASFPAGTPQQTVISTLAASLPNTKVGAIGSFPGTLARGNSYSGNTVNILADLTGGGFFIDNGKANALGSSEYIASLGGTAIINSQSGLLGTPVLERTIVRFDMIFEPGLFPGRAVQLQGLTATNLSGLYKITAVKHRGTISDAVCGQVVTTGEFFYLNPMTGVASAS